jgi:hypothetical protein
MSSHSSRASHKYLMPSNPADTDMAVIAAYFNPCGYESRRNTFRRFLLSLAEQQVPVYVAELAIGNQAHELAPSNHVLQLRAGDVMWHKERLLNLLIYAVPRRYCKIAWLDGDVIFADPAWYRKASEALTYFELIPPYATCQHLGQADDITYTTNSLAHRARSSAHDLFNFSLAQPGLAWAARRELLEAFPLLDWMVVGGGDLLMALAAYGCWEHPYIDQLPCSLRSYWRSGANSLSARIRGNVGCTDSLLRHLWHGSLRDRLYIKRLDILREHAYDPEVDVAVDASGILTWASRKPALHAAVASYFAARNEDGAP